MPNSPLPSYKLKQRTNLILHDENYTSFAVSLLVHKIGEGGAYSPGEGVHSFLTFIYNRSTNMNYFIHTEHHYTPHGRYELI